MSDNLKEVLFAKYCPTCKHNVDEPMHNPDTGIYDGEKWSGTYTKEEYIPCCYCLEEAMREGTEVPVEWEEK